MFKLGVLISPPNADVSVNPKSSATMTMKFGLLDIAVILAFFVLVVGGPSTRSHDDQKVGKLAFIYVSKCNSSKTVTVGYSIRERYEKSHSRMTLQPQKISPDW